MGKHHPKELRDQVLSWISATGAGTAEAARKFGLGFQTVATWRKRYGRPAERALVEQFDAPPEVAATPPKPLAREDAELVRTAIHLRLEQLCDPLRIKGEATPVLLQVVAQLRASYLQEAEPEEEEAGQESLGDILRLVEDGD